MKYFALSFLILFSLSSKADPIVDENFVDTFYSHYESAKCGHNILGLIERTQKLGADLSKAYYLKLKNEKYSVFGLLNAEYARNFGQKNWHFHIILYLDGKIYDFDFGDEPNVLAVHDYFEKMFLIERPSAYGKMHLVGRQVKLSEYSVEIFPALKMLQSFHGNIPPPKGQKMSFGEFLDSYL